MFEGFETRRVTVDGIESQPFSAPLPSAHTRCSRLSMSVSFLGCRSLQDLFDDDDGGIEGAVDSHEPVEEQGHVEAGGSRPVAVIDGIGIDLMA